MAGDPLIRAAIAGSECNNFGPDVQPMKTKEQAMESQVNLDHCCPIKWPSAPFAREGTTESKFQAITASNSELQRATLQLPPQPQSHPL